MKTSATEPRPPGCPPPRSLTVPCAPILLAFAGTLRLGTVSTLEPEHLNNHHRDTLLQIFQHPTSHNIEWHAVLSLLEAVGSVEQRHDGKYVVRVGDEQVVLVRPKHKDVDVQQVVDLRRMLISAGYDAVVET